MVTVTRKCMDPACQVQVSGNHLMCLPHWKEIPESIQKEVSERLSGWKNIGAAREFLSNFMSQARAAGKGLAQ